MFLASRLELSKLSDFALGLIVAIFGAVFLRIAFQFLRDFVFYRKNSWNFDLESGNNFYWGDGPNTPESKMSNKARMFFGYPFGLVVFGLILATPTIEIVRRFSE